MRTPATKATGFGSLTGTDNLEVMVEFKCNSISDKSFLSIVAGVKTKILQEGLGVDSIIRVMPNTPAQIKKGMTVWTSSKSVSPDILSFSEKILSVLGEELYVDDEALIDMSTALSGSGPAYMFLFMDALINAGINIGMSKEMSVKLVRQTLLGSIELAIGSEFEPTKLKEMVTSPGGTTEAALSKFEEGGFSDLVSEAVCAAFERSKFLGGK